MNRLKLLLANAKNGIHPDDTKLDEKRQQDLIDSYQKQQILQSQQKQAAEQQQNDLASIQSKLSSHSETTVKRDLITNPFKDSDFIGLKKVV